MNKIIKEPPCPCRYCERREIGCGATCKDFKEWREIHAARRRQINKLKRDSKAITDSHINRRMHMTYKGGKISQKQLHMRQQKSKEWV